MNAFLLGALVFIGYILAAALVIHGIPAAARTVTRHYRNRRNNR